MAGSGNRKKGIFEFETITLCGSMRFKEKILEAAKELIEKGYLVLTPNFANNVNSENITHEKRAELDALHRKKMDLADAILIINPDGYIGEHTKSEIEYAKSIKKPVYYRYIMCENDCYAITNCVAQKKSPCAVIKTACSGKTCPYYSPEDK